MTVLLDTHLWLWWLLGSPQLPSRERQAMVISVHSLPADFRGDPADRLSVATALAHGLPLATFDSSIRRSQVVPLWSAGNG